MFPPHQRDRTERTGVVATLGDLQISYVGILAKVLAYSRVIGDGIFDEASRREFGCELVEFTEVQKEIDLGNLRFEFLLVSLDQTSHGHHGLYRALPLEFACADHGLDRFSFRRIDEAARVHEHDVGCLQL